MTTRPLVLVLGATGFVGARLTTRLLREGYGVRTLTRRPAALAGADCRTGDAGDVEVLTGALEGCAAVCVAVPWEAEPAIAAALVAAARRLEARPHLLTVSGVTVTHENAGAPMVDAKLEAEATLTASGLPCTVLKPSWFMEALALCVRDGRATLFGRQTVPFRLVALDDFAACVVEALRAPPERLRTLTIEGPEALGLHEALARYCAHAHPEVAPSSLPLWVGRLLAALTRSAELRGFVALMRYFSTVTPPVAAPMVVTQTSFSRWLATAAARGAPAVQVAPFRA